MQIKECEVCGAKTIIKNTRVRKDGIIKRRRICTRCNDSFTTFEVPVTIGLKKYLATEGYDTIE